MSVSLAVDPWDMQPSKKVILTRNKRDSRQIICSNKSKKHCFDSIFEHLSAVFVLITDNIICFTYKLYYM